HGWLDSYPGYSDLDLQWDLWLESTGTANQCDGNGGERAGDPGVERVEWSDRLQREAVDGEWGTVHDGQQSHDYRIHGQRADQRDHVLLRGDGGECRRRECQLQPGECHTAGESTGAANQCDGNGGERAGDPGVERVDRSDRLQREAGDGEWGHLHDGQQSHDYRIHGQRAYQRHHVL